MLVLCLAGALGQDDTDPATPDPTADADPDTKSADDDQPDLEWEYVEFLQNKIRFEKHSSVENNKLYSSSVTKWRES